MLGALRGIAIGIVILMMTLIMCQTVLPDFLPTDGSMDFFSTLLPLAVGFGILVYIMSSIFRSNKKGE